MVGSVSWLVRKASRRSSGFCKVQEFATFCGLQTLAFVLAVVNIRALAHLQYAWAVVTDGLICLLGWMLFKKMQEASSNIARAGYVIGGMLGSIIGMWVTQQWGN